MSRFNDVFVPISVELLKSGEKKQQKEGGELVTFPNVVRNLRFGIMGFCVSGVRARPISTAS